jgi:hypothetical protein
MSDFNSLIQIFVFLVQNFTIYNFIQLKFYKSQNSSIIKQLYIQNFIKHQNLNPKNQISQQKHTIHNQTPNFSSKITQNTKKQQKFKSTNRNLTRNKLKKSKRLLLGESKRAGGSSGGLPPTKKQYFHCFAPPRWRMQLGVRTLTFGVEKFRRLGVQLA